MTDDAPKPAPADWTPEEEDRLRALRSENLTAHEIAERLGTGRSANAIHSRYARLNREANRWSDEDLATISRLHGEKAGLAEILQALPSRNRSSVSAKLRHMGSADAKRLPEAAMPDPDSDTAPERSAIAPEASTPVETPADADASTDSGDLDAARIAVNQAFVALNGHKADRTDAGDREALTLFAAIAATRDPVDTARYAQIDEDEAASILSAMAATGVWPEGGPAPAAWNAPDPEPALRTALRRIAAPRRATTPRPPLGRLLGLFERRFRGTPRSASSEAP